MLEPKWRTTYSDAEYHVYATPPFVMRINQYSADLQQLLHKHSVETAAFISAHNPRSQRFSIEENHQRQRQLMEKVRTLSLPWITGVGKNTRGSWSEDSVLILGIDEKNACDLGRHFEQNAIVWCGSAAIPHLLSLV